MELVEKVLGEQGQIGLNSGATTARRTDPNLDAPGANDDGSGTVLVMELARVFAESQIDFDMGGFPAQIQRLRRP